MAVTLYAGKSSTHQPLPGGVHPVEHSSGAKFFVIGAAFIIGHGIAMKTGCNQLCIRMSRQQISGELFR